MENEFDSSWFDLRNYDKLKDLDLLGWHRQISIRNWIEFELFSDEARDEELLEDIMLSNCPELLDDWKKIDDKSLNKSELLAELLLKEESEMKKLLDVLKAPALRWIERIKNKPIIESEDGIGLDGEYERYKAQASNLKYPFNTYSVISTPARSIRFLANDNRLSDVWKCCDYLLEEGEIDRKQSELLDTPFDLLCIERAHLGEPERVATEGYANVTVDLTATPKQIMSDFSHWLTEYKRKTGYEQERYFTKLHLSRLVQHRVLQYIDLMLVAKVEGREIDPKKATKVIYAGKKHVPDGKLKRTTEDWAKWLMRKETLFAIKAQLDETLYQS